MATNDIDVERSGDGRIARIRIPGGLFETSHADGLSRAAEDLVDDRDVRVVVIAASSSDFCSGAADDLDRYEVTPDPASALARIRVPIIAVVTGKCCSVGVELLLVADIRICDLDATFVIDDLHNDQLPAWGGTQRLPRAVGIARATSMLLLGEPIDAATAVEWGLVHEAIEDVDGAVEATLGQLAGTGPLALEFAKEAVHRGSELPLRDGLRLEGDLNHQLAATSDRAEGLAAFFDKRPPDFSGR
jgi:enoyl-CoA hydratase/carnithine racemase